MGVNYSRRAKMTFTIEQHKLDLVISLFNEQVDPSATDDVISEEILATWNEGREHQAWIDSASPQEIVDWLASFYE
jgi:hypothetical protein